MIDAKTLTAHPDDQRVAALADAVNEAALRMRHADMVVSSARDPSPKVLAALQARIEEFRDASAAWASSYFTTTGD